jgi:outer membrane protein OmpA-like peptidoglycan-associated protein
MRIFESGPLRILIPVVLAAAALTGCASMNKTEKGAVIGAAGGAIVGGAIGDAAGSTAKGAIIGAVLGGAAGATIGHQMDKQAAELRREIPGARVERVGEGILVTFDSGLLFDFDSERIRGATRSNLDALARSLNENANTDVLVVGHTDAVGDEGYNLDLSERRAGAAAEYLASHGVRGQRIDTRGRGEREPVASNQSESGRSRNRRVEVAIYANEEMRERAANQIR